jgi:hypothetical protein
MFNPMAHTLEGKITHTTQELAKLVQGDAKEAFGAGGVNIGAGSDKAASYADVKSIVERLANSDRFMKEMMVMPMGGFGMPPAAFMGAGVGTG